MGKRIIPRCRGSGRPRYRTRPHSFNVELSYPRNLGDNESEGGQITDILHDPRRSACVAKILTEDFNELYLIAADGLHVGQWLEFGDNAQISSGNVLPLHSIPEGTRIFNIELSPGDGGKFVRSGGGFASVISHDRKLDLTQVKLPSKKSVAVSGKSKATVGVVAGAGRLDKPRVHAGQSYHARRARGKLYPEVGGTSMNAVDHPHGGGGHPHVGKPTTVSRSTPPGRKVGHIAARRTGKRK